MGIISSLNKKNIFDRVQMNKFTFVAVLFLVNAAFATSFLKSGANSPIFAQLKKVEETSFGKNLLDTIALQVQNQAPLADISRLLANLKADLERQQAEADQLQSEREAECAQAIAEYNRRIEVAEGIIDETTENIANLKAKIAELKTAIANLKQTIATLKEHLAELIADDAAERDAFANRIEAYNTQLEGLDQIIEMLKTQRDEEGEAVPDVQSLLQLAKIGKKNPMAALVQVAASLPREQWEKAVNLMSELRERIAQKKAADIQQEAARIQKFEQDKAALEKNIASNQQKLRETEAELAENEQSLEEKTAQCNKWREEYERDSEKRGNEIDVVEQVQQIFSNRIASAKDYLKERIDQE